MKLHDLKLQFQDAPWFLDSFGCRLSRFLILQTPGPITGDSWLWSCCEQSYQRWTGPRLQWPLVLRNGFPCHVFRLRSLCCRAVLWTMHATCNMRFQFSDVNPADVLGITRSKNLGSPHPRFVVHPASMKPCDFTWAACSVIMWFVFDLQSSPAKGALFSR